MRTNFEHLGERGNNMAPAALKTLWMSRLAHRPHIGRTDDDDPRKAAVIEAKLLKLKGQAPVWRLKSDAPSPYRSRYIASILLAG